MSQTLDRNIIIFSNIQASSIVLSTIWIPVVSSSACIIECSNTWQASLLRLLLLLLLLLAPLIPLSIITYEQRVIWLYKHQSNYYFLVAGWCIDTKQRETHSGREDWRKKQSLKERPKNIFVRIQQTPFNTGDNFRFLGQCGSKVGIMTGSTAKQTGAQCSNDLDISLGSGYALFRSLLVITIFLLKRRSFFLYFITEPEAFPPPLNAILHFLEAVASSWKRETVRMLSQETKSDSKAWARKRNQSFTLVSFQENLKENSTSEQVNSNSGHSSSDLTDFDIYKEREKKERKYKKAALLLQSVHPPVQVCKKLDQHWSELVAI